MMMKMKIGDGIKTKREVQIMEVPLLAAAAAAIFYGGLKGLTSLVLKTERRSRDRKRHGI